MEGASALDTSILQGKHMINIDSEEEGSILAACAGGTNLKTMIPFAYETDTRQMYEISISGLAGGHSGTEIDKNHGNAHKMMGELLGKTPGVTISKIGEHRNRRTMPFRMSAFAGLEWKTHRSWNYS